MDPFSWLLISDLHLKSEYTTWSQRVVLRDMVRDIADRLSQFPAVRFTIVSGDLAHGGKPEQYRLVEQFLDDLVTAVGIERSDVIIVPGNHDIDRDLQQLAFHGARSQFGGPESVERYLSMSSERGALLQRLDAYYTFERHFCSQLGPVRKLSNT